MEIIKTRVYEDGLSANRARAFASVLNPENRLTEKRLHEANGKWSHDRVTFFGKAPLYVASFHRGTHPGDYGVLRVDKYEKSEAPEVVYTARGDDDFFQKLPEELLSLSRVSEVFDFMRRFMRDALARTLILNEEFREQFTTHTGPFSHAKFAVFESGYNFEEAREGELEKLMSLLGYEKVGERKFRKGGVTVELRRVVEGYFNMAIIVSDGKEVREERLRV